MPSRRSSAFRLAVMFSLAFTLVCALLGTAGYRAMRGALWRQLDARIEAESATLAALQASPRTLLQSVTARTEHGDHEIKYAVVGPDGARRAGIVPVTLPEPGWSETQFRKRSGELDPARTLTTRLADGSLLLVAADPEAVEDLDERMVPAFALIFGLMALAGVGGSFLLGNAMRRRLDDIDRAARAIIGGKLDQRMPVSAAHDEFDRLSLTLNAMLDRIAVLMDNLRQASGDIAHDLRTPLTRLRQKLELAEAEGADVATLRTAIADAVADTDEMLTLFTAILSISELEAGGLNVTGKTFDLSALVRDLAESYRPSAEDAGRSLTDSIAEGVAMRGSRELIAQLGVNLLDNVMRHTPPGTAIAIKLATDPENIVLTVADSGEGIAEADRARVLQRFTRLERSRSTPGHGLGLSLVAAIAHAHTGTIRIADNAPGARMIVTFPRSLG